MNKLTNFFTLTLDREKWPDAEAAWEGIAKVWNRACQAIRRQLWPRSKIGRKRRLADGLELKRFKFAANLEKHPGSDWPHIHLQTDCYVPVDEKHRRESERTLVDIWDKAGGGIIVYAMQIESGAAEYMCKQYRVSQYVTKDLVNIGDFVKRRKRVVWRSRGLKKSVAEKRQVKFVKGYRPFDEFGNQTLTDKEINGIILNDIGMVSSGNGSQEEKEYLYEKSQQEGSDLAEAQFSLLNKGSESCGQNLESDRARQTFSEADQEFERKKAENQRANQEAEGLTKMAKSWKEWCLTNKELDDKIEESRMESFHPLCKSCPLTKSLKASLWNKEARRRFAVGQGLIEEQ